jgi:ABC-type antimicrobial peptide transport system permease subunit
MHAPESFRNYNAMRDDLLKTGTVENIAESSSPSTQIWNNYGDLDWKGKDPKVNAMFGMIAVTHDFGETIGWHLKEGRNFSRDFPTDSGSFILNEAAVKLTGFKNPVGETMKWKGENRVITGVIKDMVIESPYMPARPTVFFLQYDDWLDIITIKIKPDLSVQKALTMIEPVFKKYNPGSPYEYKFTDEEYAKKFSNEVRIGDLVSLFAVLAVFISCLGLFGLASFVAEQRTKEIGVRKVLGASVLNLWQLLSKEFVMLIVISLLIAIPIASYFMHNWLQNFHYRTEISWWIFVVAGAGALGITFLTVSFQAIKAALANPVKSLRTE